MKKLWLLCIAVLVFGVETNAQQFPEELSLKDIFHEPFLPGTRASFSHYSPDGKTVYFRWSEEGTSELELYQVGLSGKNLKKAPENTQRNYELSPDGKQVLFVKKGELILADADFGNERTVVSSRERSYNPKWKSDGSTFAFVQKGDVWIAGVEEPYLKQVTHKKENEPNYRIIDWAGDNRFVLSQSDNSNHREYYFPEYVGKYVKTGATRRGISTQIVSVARIDSAKPEVIFEREGYLSTAVSANGNYLALDWTDAAMKKRELSVVNLNHNTTKVVFEDKTDGWFYGLRRDFAPAGNKLMFQSERDGWNHIYTVNPDGSGLKQHTFGSYDIPWAEWQDHKTILMATSENDRGEIQISKLDLESNLPTKLTVAEGYRQGFRLSHDRRYVVYSKTYFNEPFDLYVLDTRIPKKEVKLTNTVPESFYEYDWQKEEYVQFTGRDGQTRLSMSVLRPAKRNPAGNPVVVFVHGAGSLQNVYKGWSSSYWREYMFHQYLTHKGYYVIEVDYRHSTGYGRKFREDVTNWMGKYETEDIEDGLAFLADNFPKADTSRVGVYGGSYGGFMALYTVSVSPERFDAAAALRAVTNWENYYHTNPWYTLPRLGTPEADSANYARSSPLTYADSLSKPVLILHGLIDNNVGFQDAAQYVERLIQSGNEDFDMMMYPSERHGFTDEDSWYDEYRRIYNFFERELKQ